MSWFAVIARFTSLCFLAGVVRATREPADWWTGIGIVMGCLACAVFWTQANRLDGMK
jgi:hypothetical protein